MTTQNEQVTIAMAAAVHFPIARAPFPMGALSIGTGTAAPLAIVTSTFNSDWCSCALGSSVNTLRDQLIFPSKLDFCNLFKFPATKSTQKSIFFTPALKIVN
jgi:hypothetical protein